ncbi:hypothetical protein FRB98_004536 [Tulasnella sp. 332]|nr:hypothetical protein FRB98_004536 [Tulasnella sp. 332]
MPFYASPGAHPTSHGLESPYGSTSQSSQGNRTGSLAAQQWHPQPYENLVPYGYVPSPPTSSNYGLGPQIPLDHHSGFTYGASPLSDQRNRPGSLARQYLQPRPQGNFVPDGYEPSPPIAPYGIEPQLARMYQSGLLFGREAPPSLPNSLGIPPPPTQLPKVPPQPDAQLRSYFHSADKDQYLIRIPGLPGYMMEPSRYHGRCYHTHPAGPSAYQRQLDPIQIGDRVDAVGPVRSF